MLVSASKKCDFPDCEKDCYTDKYGHQYEYCCRSHGKWHAEMKQQQQQQAYYAPQYMSRPSPPTTGPIRFYNSDEPYYEFTNFYKVMIKVDGELWPTTEHYFQAQKFVGTPYVEYIRRLSRAREAFEFARIPGVSHWRRNDWENVKIDIMKKALLAKFSQHPYDLCRLLLGTRKRKLIEHSPHDSFWGDGGDGSGRNELGKLLMDIRTVLQRRSTKNWEEQYPSESKLGKDSSVDDECDQHKSKPDSSKSPDNEPLSSSTASDSEYSTPPDTSDLDQSDQNQQNIMDTSIVPSGSSGRNTLPLLLPETRTETVQPTANSVPALIGFHDTPVFTSAVLPGNPPQQRAVAGCECQQHAQTQTLVSAFEANPSASNDAGTGDLKVNVQAASQEKSSVFNIRDNVEPDNESPLNVQVNPQAETSDVEGMELN